MPVRHDLARHSLVWVTPVGWERAFAGMTQPEQALAMLWRDCDWPGVVRRSESLLETGGVPLGLPLPPGRASGLCKGLRLGCTAAPEDIRTVRDAVLLETALDDALLEWRPALHGLIDALMHHGMVPRVYGSLAFQHVTGRQYLRATSDIDVLIQPASAAQLLAGTNVLERFASCLPLDGEIVFPDGRAVAWKEWHQAYCMPPDRTVRVLAKRADRIELIKPQQLLNSFQKIEEVMPC